MGKRQKRPRKNPKNKMKFTPSSPQGKLVIGTLKRHPDGFGFVIPDDKKHKDIYIPAGQVGSALTYDRVEVLTKKRRGKEGLFFGSIQTIQRRHWEWVCGPCEMTEDPFLLTKHNLPTPRSVSAQNPQKLPIKKGDWVRVKITSWPERESRPLEGLIVENLGVITSSAKDDNARILAEKNISINFPEPVLQELKDFPDEVRPEDFKEREDLRDKAFVTIDGADAKDFDDAVFVEKHPFGYRLFVAIADVSHYVREGSLLDQEARLRGNSTYLPDQAVPMLPEKLSNGLCSINPQVPRLAFTAEMDFNSTGDLLKSRFYPAVMESKRRLTYGEAQEILDNPENGGEQAFFKHADLLARILIQRQDQNGALDFNLPETSVKVDHQGEPVEVIKETRLFSHRLVEQFMLATNQAVSLFLNKHKYPLMYRVHEPPESESLKQLENFSKSLGFPSALNSRENLLAFLKKFKNQPSEPLINKLTLRALSQARYSAFNKGHYGLNFDSYTHFTSPIRRYCDLTIHRLVRRALLSSEKGRPCEKELEKQAVWISGKEQNSVKAERKTADIKKARFLKPHTGEEFDGVISSVTSFGLFISLEKFDIEGLTRFRDLPGRWIFDSDNLSAERKPGRYRLRFGDPVRIRVTAVNTETGAVDFQLLSHKDHKIPTASLKPEGRSGRFKSAETADGKKRKTRRSDRPARSTEDKTFSGGKQMKKSRRPDRPFPSSEDKTFSDRKQMKKSRRSDRPAHSNENKTFSDRKQMNRPRRSDRPSHSNENKTFSGGKQMNRPRRSDRPAHSNENKTFSDGKQMNRPRRSDRPFPSSEDKTFSGGRPMNRPRRSDRPSHSTENKTFSGGRPMNRPRRSDRPSHSTENKTFSGGKQMKRPHRSDRPSRSTEDKTFSGGKQMNRPRRSDRPSHSTENKTFSDGKQMNRPRRSDRPSHSNENKTFSDGKQMNRPRRSDRPSHSNENKTFSGGRPMNRPRRSDRPSHSTENKTFSGGKQMKRPRRSDRPSHSTENKTFSGGKQMKKFHSRQRRKNPEKL